MPPTPTIARQFNYQTCTGPQLRHLAEAALAWLTTNHPTINALNVFPIPDGDTGTNMLLTMQAACKELAQTPEASVSKVAHTIAHGALMGARGNSGVILSQIWRGFARGLENLDMFDAAAAAHALRIAKETAFRGVVKPVEGTILTVIRDVATAAEHAAQRTDDLREFLDEVVKAANDSVARTPELLPVLKQAGVVDSGGKGLAVVLEGMLRYLRNLPLDETVGAPIKALDLSAVGAMMDAVEPGQEWETVVDFRPTATIHLPTLYQRLEQMGASIQVGEGDGLYRVHIHLLRTRRYEPVELAEEFGVVTNVHMENLLDQLAALPKTEPLALTQVTPGQIAVLAVSPGTGLSKIMASLGAAAIITGGQTMNPSTQDMLDAIRAIPTDKFILLPNNKNIIMAARQAADVLAGQKQVVVMPSRTIPQGIAALFQHNANGDLEAVKAAMEHALGEIESGEVTTATRSVDLDGVSVKDGQIIGLHNGALKVAGDDVTETVMRLLETMQAGKRELITLYFGADVTLGQAETMANHIRTAYPNHSVELHSGGQPHYLYILSAE